MNNIENLKKENLKLIQNSEDAIKVFKKAREAIAKNIPFEGLQSFESMRRFPSGSIVPLDGNINILLHHGEETISWLTIIPAGGFFKSHYHDCHESCVVVYGEALELTTSETYKAGDVIIYEDKGEDGRHEPSNPSLVKDLKLHVTFTKKPQE